MIRTIKPLADKILVSHIKMPTKTESGLHLPEDANYRDDRMQYRVLAVGPKVTSLQVGDRILCPLYTGEPILIEDGIERFIMRERDAIMFWRNEGKAPAQS